MAMTLNGYIAKPDESVNWSEAAWKSYESEVKKTGNLIIGRKTYELMLEDGSFNSLQGVVFVVVSSNVINNENVLSAKSPQEALDILGNKGFDQVLIGGGTKLNTSFLKLGLIDEVLIDIEPMIWGKGIPLFSNDEFEFKLELIESKTLSQNTIHLHYRLIG